ncbi:DUF6297 family protein [Catellatospora sichuanensis]|uniref:DUF6297 family protein n=1 Tax=Catellatospora sichuanensis TaxID=1969805 RepID=UPI0011824BC9|nr:DUF6297 family protein [Catellatospora sichuanensis]
MTDGTAALPMSDGTDTDNAASSRADATVGTPRTGDAAARAARAAIRSPGRRHADKHWSDRCLPVAGVAVGGALLFGPFQGLLSDLSTPVPPAPPVTAVGGVALAVAALAGLIRVAAVAGPVLLTPADARWLLMSPMPRRAVLGPAALRVAVAAVICGVLLGGLVLSLLGIPDHGALRLAAAVLCGGSYTLTGVGLAALAQRSERSAARLRRVAVGTAVLALLTGATLAAAGVAVRPLLVVPLPAVLVTAGAGALCALVTAVLVWRSLATFPAPAVLDAATRLSAAGDAVVALEPSFLSRVAENAYWRERRPPSRPWPAWPGPLVLAWSDWRGLRRRPARLALLALSTLVPVLLATVWPDRPLLFAAAVFVLGLAAASAGAGGVRRETGSPALRRLFGVGDLSADAARLVLPALLAAAWLAAALGLLESAGALPGEGWVWLGPAAAGVPAVAALRMARRGHIDHASTPVVMPMLGSRVPIGWLTWCLSGLDVAVPGLLPLLLALSGTSAAPGPVAAAQAALSVLVLAGYLWRRHR